LLCLNDLGTHVSYYLISEIKQFQSLTLSISAGKWPGMRVGQLENDGAPVLLSWSAVTPITIQIAVRPTRKSDASEIRFEEAWNVT
jgi:hypothetical protein